MDKKPIRQQTKKNISIYTSIFQTKKATKTPITNTKNKILNKKFKYG